MRPPLATATLVLTLLLAGCVGDGDDPSTPPPSSPAGSASSTSSDPGAGPVRPTVTGTVASGFNAPWGVAFLPGGDALVTQRDDAAVLRVSQDGRVRRVAVIPQVEPGGEGGLLGIAVSPDFATDRTVFVYATTEDDNQVLSFELEPGRQPDIFMNVVNGIEKSSIHNGGRIAFGPDGHLYVATGDAGDTSLAQDRNSLNGKILRMTPDGQPVAGNLRDDSLVYSLGHRNVQGLAWDSRGRMYASEFGQSTWDELNRIRAGANYGWPEVQGRQGGDSGGDGRFVAPLAQWSTDEASPSGIAIVDDTVLMAGLRGERLWVVDVSGDDAGEPRAVLEGEHGRLRTVVAAPDGSVWLTTSNTDGRGDVRDGDDRILRLTY